MKSQKWYPQVPQKRTSSSIDEHKKKTNMQRIVRDVVSRVQVSRAKNKEPESPVSEESWLEDDVMSPARAASAFMSPAPARVPAFASPARAASAFMSPAPARVPAVPTFTSPAPARAASAFMSPAPARVPAVPTFTSPAPARVPIEVPAPDDEVPIEDDVPWRVHVCERLVPIEEWRADTKALAARFVVVEWSDPVPHGIPHAADAAQNDAEEDTFDLENFLQKQRQVKMLKDQQSMPMTPDSHCWDPPWRVPARVALFTPGYSSSSWETHCRECRLLEYNSWHREVFLRWCWECRTHNYVKKGCLVCNPSAIDWRGM